MTSLGRILNGLAPAVTTRPVPRDPDDLLADAFATQFEAQYLREDADDLEAAGDHLGARRLRVQAAEFRVLSRELHELARHWRTMRGKSDG